MNAVAIREYQERDLAGLIEVSRRGDAMFAEAGVVLPEDDPAESFRIAERAFTAVHSRPVGFATVGSVDGSAHLEQVAVDPDFGRRGIGTRLLETVCADAAARGFGRVTLTTFRDVAWNAPWYRERGFRELPVTEWGAQLRHLWHAEVAAGIHAAPRIAMVRTLDASM